MSCLSASRLLLQIQEQEMFALITIVLSCPLLFFSDAAYVDTFTKCGIKDDQCMRDIFQKSIHDIGDTGIAELNIPPIDPVRLTDISVTVLDALVITLTDGSIKGFKNCTVNRISVDVDKQLVKEEFECDVLTIKGHFAIGGTSEVFKSLFGNDSVSGNGKIRIKLEKATMIIDLPITVIKKEDGDTYLKVSNKAKYNYDLKKATFDIKNLVMGNTDISEIATAYLNDNWKTITKSFGNVFVKKGLDYVLLLVQKFYDTVSTKYFVAEDLTPFVKN